MSATTQTPEALIRTLALQSHPEGGWYREVYRSPHRVQTTGGGWRAACTSIDFLLCAGERSAWHQVDGDEIWHWHCGGPLALELAQNGQLQRVDLGVDLEAGQRAQAIVPAHVWQRAWPLGDFTWVSCTVAPGFEFSGFVLAPPDFDPLRDTQDRLR